MHLVKLELPPAPLYFALFLDGRHAWFARIGGRWFRGWLDEG